MKKGMFKIVFSLIVFTYVFSTIGVCVIAHYCDGELEKVSLFSKPSTCCDGEEEESEANDCCENDIKHVVNQQDFPFSQLVADCKVPVLFLSIFDFQSTILNFEEEIALVNTSIQESRPPNLVQQDIVSYSVIRI